ncbi:MAG: hypothetical protein V7727_21340 [Sneathiella sp.]
MRIELHDAGIVTRAGSGILRPFNDPSICDGPAGNALRLGKAMRLRA